MPKKKKTRKDPAKRRLTAKELAAVEAFLDPEVKTQAAAIMRAYPRAAGWSRNTADVYACEVFQRPHVAAAIERGRERMMSNIRARTEAKAEDIINEFRCLAMARLTDVFQYHKSKDRWGRDVFKMDMTEFDNLTDQTKAAIKKVKIRAIPRKNGLADIQEVELQLYDKQAALDSLAKYFGLYVERLDVVHSGAVGHVHTSIDELRALYEAMTTAEREAKFLELADKIQEQPEDNG